MTRSGIGNLVLDIDVVASPREHIELGLALCAELAERLEKALCCAVSARPLAVGRPPTHPSPPYVTRIWIDRLDDRRRD